MMEGLVIGVTGLVLGSVIGYLGCVGLDRYEFPIETDVYYLSSLPVVILPANFLVTGLATLAVCFLATLYPAWEAARLNPVDGLRYE
jgi:lipoprotein-releasing system permease protein